jgi:hypothetical protein
MTLYTASPRELAIGSTRSGQASVGNVEGFEGWVRAKLEDQPHVLGYAPGETLRSENAERETEPVARDGER